MPVLNKDQILSADDKKYVEVEVPEWGGTIRVGTITALERDALQNSMLDEKKQKISDDGMTKFRTRLCATAMVDETGKRLFMDEEVEHLGQKSPAAMDRIFTAANKLNALTPAEIEATKKN